MFARLSPKKKAFFKETFETLGTAIILALIIRSFIIQPFKIPTGSMEPTLLPGDRILVVRFIYGLRVPFTFKRVFEFKKPETGDIIVFNYPEDTKRAFIKRCIARSGDKVKIKDGSIWVNGSQLTKPPINQIYYYNRGELAREDELINVPQNSFFVLGDNSASSKDSRYWGFLNDKFLIGKAVMVYWPLNRIKILK